MKSLSYRIVAILFVIITACLAGAPDVVAQSASQRLRTTSEKQIDFDLLGLSVDNVLKILSDTELNYTEVIERWADRSGIYGPPEHFYVLVRMEKRTAESVLRRIK